MTEHRKQYLKEYQRKWMAARRKRYFDGKHCAECGSAENLELDHINPADKLHHAVWSWKESRRAAEIKKCQVLCGNCHQKKTSAYLSELNRGKPHRTCRRFTTKQVLEIREKISSGRSERSIAKEYGFGKSAIRDIKIGKTYQVLD